ncbi:MAG: NAD(P)/FAD-dependent oxidoreductase [Rubrivivax sp.]|nr:NAD(P)/FAD-dependent oxidoreductase [Rubrivivax sp.]MBK8526102.1 NAD(P)/FAD-dependent oxidoreductase [Rubrivivax sp.]
MFDSWAAKACSIDCADPSYWCPAVKSIETDYLVIGSGAAGLAFVDTLIDETDAQVTLVDRHGKPGGHWNDAYSFVSLHQPSAFYGVNSMELGSRRTDRFGLNKGLYELASGPEVCGYFDRVMNHKLLPSGRVAYHPMCNHLGGGVVESILSGKRTQVVVRRKIVDATYHSPSVPATHRPAFEVAAGVRLVPPNALPQLWTGLCEAGLPRHFVIVGAGKTAMDAAVWLINAGADPDAIQWLMPRDSWLINRITTQPGPEFFDEAIGGQADQMQAMAEASSVDDLFLRLEACGMLLRIDPARTPTMFHLATIAPGEVELLRRIRNVVRLGRVQRIAPDRVTLEHGQLPVAPDTLFIDCTASAVEPRPTQPIFQGDQIVLQLVRLPQPAFSAALIAYVEAHYDGDKAKNRLCGPVPFPHRMQDYPRSMMANLWNQAQWGQDKILRSWIRQSRLDGFGKLMTGIDPNDSHKQAIMVRLKDQAMAAMANLPKLS